MNVIVHAKNFKVSQALRAFCELQTARLERLSQRLVQVSIHLEIIKQKSDLNSAQVTIRIMIPGKDVVVQKSSFDLYAAINEAIDRATRELRKEKEKRSRKRLAIG